MRKNVIAGNWKMNKDLNESVVLISEIINSTKGLGSNVGIIICPPFTSLETANALLKNSDVALGAQNMHYESGGAYTGEITANMLRAVGCKYVIVGHSERRTLFGETNEIINKKLKSAFNSGLYPIFCIGETLEEREGEITEQVVEKQIREGLAGIVENDFAKIIIAYEPVWAIGTGKTASPEQAQEVHKFIRKLISELYSAVLADSVTIQYGGSVKPDNANELLSQPDIDGALVGGACLQADSFIEIIKAAK
ncbi:MAG: triose-phosphate isomerase [Bacteroidetes bacterium]|nr:triose-phosphate isomerase [Bacteroidota bacterium]